MNEFFSGKCSYIEDNKCPDIIKMNDGRKFGNIDEDLEDQYYNLCTSGGKCLTREKLLEEELAK